MGTYMIGDIPTSSVTEMKKNPMNVVGESRRLKKAVYLLNRNKPVAVVIDKDKYEEMQNLIETLEKKILYAEVEKRVKEHDSQEKPKTYSLEEAGIDLSKVEYSEDDGWE